MSDEIFFDGRRYISANDAASSSDLTRDYIARLCRDGKISGRRVGKHWYVEQASLNAFLINQEYLKSRRSESLTRERAEEYHGTHTPQRIANVAQIHAVSQPRKVPTFSEIGTSVFAQTPAHVSRVISSRADEIKNKMALAVAAQAHGGGAHAKDFFNAPGGFAHAALSGAHIPVYALTPVTEFFHKVVALALTLMLTFGTYAAVDPSYARFAANSVRENVQSALDSYRSATGGGFGELAARTQSQVAAAAEDPKAAVASVGSALTDGLPHLAARLARAVHSQVNDLVYAVAFPFELVGSRSTAGNASVSVEVAPYTPKSTPAIAAAPARGTTAQTVITNPVIERIVETTRLVSQGGITEEILDRKLAELDSKLSSRLVSSSAAQTTNVTNVYAAAASVGRIEHLDELDLTNPTITGGSIASAGISDADSLSVAGLSALSTTTVTGDLTVTGSFSLTAANATFTNSTTTNSTSTNLYSSSLVAGNSTSTNTFSTNLVATNATSTNLFATNASTTNATSTNLFSVLSTFTTSAISTLTATLATITDFVATNLTATNATTTNATSTNAYASNLDAVTASTTNLTFVNATGTSATTTNLFATTTRFVNATSTSLFATLAHFTTGIIDALTSYTEVAAPSFFATSTSATSTFAGGLLATRAPTLAHTFSPWAIGAANANLFDASFVVNPASATGDSNLIAAAVGGSVKFIVDAEGDVFVNNLTSVGSVTLSTTTASTFNVEGNATFGDSITDVTTVNGSLVVTGTTTASTIQGNFGIGTTSPWARLSVAGAAGATAPLFTISSSTAAFATSTAFLIDQNGKVGIGTTSPSAQFSVNGNTLLGGSLTASGDTTLANATTTNLFSTTASSTNLFSTNGNIGVLSAGTLNLTTLSATNGTFSGTLGVTGLSTFTQASTTRLSVFDKAYFGGSATTTIDSAGNVAVAGTLNVTGGTTLSNATTTNLFATNASTTNSTSTNQYSSSLIAGNATSTNLYTTNFNAANSTSTNLQATAAVFTSATSTNFFATLGRFTNSIVDTLLTAVSATITNLTATTLTATNATSTRLDAYDYVAVGRAATTTLRGDGVASTIPYASSTAVSVSGTGYFATASTTNLTVSSLTSGRIPYITTAGAFTDSSSLTFDGTTLTAPRGAFSSTSGTTTIASGQGFTVGGSQFIVQQTSGRIGVGTTTPASIFDIYGTDAIRIPVGTTAQRPAQNGVGQVRYNTTTHQFEGYGDNSVWQGLGGVIDADQDTSITADTNNTDEDTLRFFTFGTEQMTIKPSGQIGIGTNAPHASALVDFSTTTRGVLFPRLTSAQKNVIASPAAGLTVFDTTVSKLNVYNGSAWKNVGATEINGEVTSGTTGSVLFVGDGGILGQDNANFYYATSTGLLSLTRASSTRLSVFDRAYFGATATTTIDSTGAITVTSANANTFPYASSTAVSVSGTGYFATASTTNLTVSSIPSATPYTSATGAISGASLAASSVYVTNGSSVPSWTTTLPAFTLGGAVAGNGQSITGLTGVTSTYASTTRLSVFDKAYFGGSATTTIDSAGNVAVAGTLNVTGGTTLSNATTTNLFSTTASSTNLFSTNLNAGTVTLGHATTTNLFSTTASSTNLFSTNLNAGTVTLGNATSTNMYVSSTLSLGGNFNPATDNTSLIGTSTLRFKEGNFGPSGVNVWNVGGTSNYEQGSLAFSSNVLKLSTAAPVGGNFRDIQLAPGNSSGLYLSAGGPVGLGYTSLDTSIGNALLVNGRIGIGTTTPGGPLVVSANGRATGDLRYGLQIVNTDSANTKATNIAFAGGGGTGASSGNWFIGTDALHDNSSNFFIATSTGANAYKQFVFNGEGTFTLGKITASPSVTTDKLYNLNGSIYWNGTDLTGGVTNYWARTGSNLTVSTVTDNVGIGATTTPGARLAVAGAAGGTTPLLMISSSTAAFATTTVFQIDSGGTATLTGALLPGGTITNNLAAYDLGATGSRWNALWAGTLNIGTSTFSLKSDANSNLGIFTAASGGGTQAMTVTSAGNVGIGTTSPFRTLSVAGTGIVGGTFSSGSSNVSQQLTSSFNDASDSFNYLTAGDGSLGLIVKTQSSGTFKVQRASTVDFIVTSAGNVGIGTSTPSARLDVAGGYIRALDNGTNSGPTTGKGVEIVGTGGQGYIFSYNRDAGSYQTLNMGVSNTQLVLHSGGNIGIGTTTPGATLSITGASNPEFALYEEGGGKIFSLNDTGAADSSQLRMWDGTTLAVNICSNSVQCGSSYFNGGNVGIGTTSPVSLLTLSGSSPQLTVIDTSGVSAGAGGKLAFYNTYSSANNVFEYASVRGLREDATQSSNAGILSFYTVSAGSSNTEKMRITSTGNVGIGTTTPGVKLDVLGNTGTVLRLAATVAGSSNDVSIDFAGKNGDPIPTYARIALGVNTGTAGAESGYLNFSTINAGTLGERVRITKEGNVGIGTTSPREILQLEANNPMLRFETNISNSGVAGMNFYEQNVAKWSIALRGSDDNLYFGEDDQYPVANPRLVLQNGGNVGIGDTSPDALFDVKGTVCLDLNADEACTDNTAAISDARLKTNVANITGGLQLVKQLRPVTFTWNGEYNTGTADSLGFLAQEVETIFPELVITDTAGYKNLDYGKLTAVLASAIQELDTKVDNILNGTATSTITNVAYQNASTTATDNLCLGGSCITAWDQLATTTAFGQPLDLSEYATLDAVNSLQSTVYSELNSATSSLLSTVNSQLSTSLNVATSTLANSFNVALSSEALRAKEELASATSSLAASFADQLAAAIAGVATTTNITNNITYATTTIADLSGYVATSTLASTLASYLTMTDLTGTVDSLQSTVYSQLNAATSSLASSLLSTVNSQLTTTLGSYATFADIPSPVTLANLSGTVTGNILPSAHNTYDLGTNENRFANIYAQNIHAGDLTFTETTSAISGEAFTAGDMLTLYVTSTGANTATIPINLKTAINSNNWGSNNIFFNTSGSLAIGIASTTAPRGKLDVEGAIAAGDTRLFTLANTSGANGNAAIPYSMYIPSTTGDLNIASNDNSQGSQVNASYSSWNVKLGGQTDAFAIQRSAAGSLSYSNLFNITSAGNATLSGALTAAGITNTSTSTAKAFAASALGAVGSPAYSFSNDTDTGLWSPAANTLAWSTGGSERMRVDSSGNVGIGTTTPGAKLEVSDTNKAFLANTANLFVRTTDADANDKGGTIGLGSFANPTAGFIKGARESADNGYLALGTWQTGVGNAERMRITSTGNVGIGTTTPANKLTIAPAINSGISIITSGANGASGIDLNVNDTRGILQMYSSGTENVRINPANTSWFNGGNVGIGNTSPSYKLDVSGDINVAAGSTYKYNGTTIAQASTTLANFFFGPSGNLTTTGTGNIGVGYVSLSGLTSGGNNTAVGRQALENTTTGGGNSALGYLALNGNTSGTLNTAIGQQALATATSTTGEVAFGYGALQNDTAGGPAGATHANTAIGYQALTLNTYGDQNTALGFQTLATATSSRFNTAIGYRALLSNANKGNSFGGWYNVAVGGLSLYQNTYGGANTSVGEEAMAANTTGNSNVAMGNVALTANTTGSNNVAIGANALGANQTGSLNTAVGYQALFRTTTDNNIGLGYYALGDNTSGGLNLGLGYQAGYSDSAAITGSTNILIGYLSGRVNSAGTTGTNLSGSGNITIGTNGNMIVDKTASNQLNIGNLIFGTGLATGNTVSTGNVGIGNTAPNNTLTVGGTNGQSNALISARGGSATGNAFEWGHGNTAGYGNTIGYETSSGASFVCFMCEGGTNANTYKTRGNPGHVLVAGAGGDLRIARVTTASADNQSRTDDVFFDANGAVGIGAGPNASAPKLTVTTGSSYARLDPAEVAQFIGNYTTFRSSDNAKQLMIGFNYGTPRVMTQTNDPLVFAVNTAEAMRIDTSGNVGIGTSTQIAQGKQFIAFNGTTHQAFDYNETTGAGSFTFGQFLSNLTVVGSITGTTNSTAYNQSSDVRLKENIADTAMGLDELSQIQVRDFNFITDPSHRTQGFIAQELYDVYPLAVTVGGDDPNTNPWQVDYGRLTPLIVKSVQELDQKFENYIGSGVATSTQIAVINATSTNTDELCLGGECRTSWPSSATSTDLSGYAKLTDIPSIANFATRDDLAVATSSLFAAINAIEVPSLAGYAKLTDIPSVANFATRDDLAVATSSFASQLASAISGLATTTPDLSGYARLTDIPDVASFVSTSSLASTLSSYLTADDIDLSDYLTFTDLSEYATLSDLASSEALAKARLDAATSSLLSTINSQFAASFVSTSTLATTLGSYATFADIPSPVTLANLSGTVTGNILPSAHNTYDLGTNENRFANIYAQNIHAGDLTFTETTSAISGEAFTAGDMLTLYVTSTGANTATIPINLKTAINSNNWGSNNIFFNTSGSLAIGIASTTAPTGKLDIHSASDSEMRLLTLTQTAGASNAALPYTFYIATSTGDLNIASNDNSRGSLVNSSYSAWNVKLGGQTDAFAIQRSAAGSLSYSNLFNITSAGNATLSGALTAAGITNTSTSTAKAFAASALGAVGSPAYSFSNDTDTGLWSPAANTLAWSTGGSERMRVDSSGNVGIGTTTPTSLLHLYGAGTILRGDSDGGLTVKFWRHSNDTAAANIVQTKSRGTTVTPTIVQSGDGIGGYSFNAYDGASELGAASITAAVDGTPGTNDMPGRLMFNTTADGASAVSERMRIDSSGNVGIGTTTPYAKLSIVSASPAAPFAALTVLSDSASSYTGIGIGRTGIDSLWGVAGGTGHYVTGATAGDTVVRSNGSDIHFTTDSGVTNQMTLLNGGNVGIGNTSPTGKLDVLSGTANTYGDTPALGVLTTSTQNPTLNGGGSFTGTLTLNSNDSQAADKGGSLVFGGRFADADTRSATYAGIFGAKSNSTSGNLDGYLAFSTRNNTVGVVAERMRIDASGNVGIATTTPTDYFVVNQAATNRGAVLIRGGDQAPTTYNTRIVDSAYNPLLYVYNDGKVGIGTTTPGYKLSVETAHTAASCTGTTNLDILTCGTLDVFNNSTATINDGAFLSLSTNYSGGKTTRAAIKGGSELVSGNASGYLAFFTNTAGSVNNLDEKMRITTAGNVGIGETSPDAKLHVLNTNASSNDLFKLQSGIDAAGEYDQIRFNITSDTPWTAIRSNIVAAGDSSLSFLTTTDNGANLTEKLTIDHNGNVQFGANATLSRNTSDAADSGYLQIGGGGDVGVARGAYINLGGNEATGVSLAGDLQLFAGNVTGGKVSLFTGNAAERMTIDESGNVGIGTSTPFYKMDISESTGSGSDGIYPALRVINWGTATHSIAKVVVAAGGNTVRAVQYTGIDTSVLGANFPAAGGGIIGTETNHAFSIMTNAAGRMTIDSSGLVGIGTASPDVKLHLESSSGDLNIRMNNTAANSTNFMIKNGASDNRVDFVFDGSSKVTFKEDGKVGIGATVPDQGMVEVKGGSVCVDTDSDDNASSCIASESDARLKTNIATISGSSSLDVINALNPVSFDWRTTDPEVLKHYPLIGRFASSTHSIGLIAQEVMPVLPEALSLETVGDSEVQYFQLDYTKFIPHLVGAIKEIASLGEAFRAKLVAWFADAANGIGDVFAKAFHAKDEICIGDTCVNEDQLKALLAGQTAGAASAAGSTGSPQAGGDSSSTPDASTSTPDTTDPVITLNGENPATILLGETYADMGATATDNHDTVLYIYASVDGGPTIEPGSMVTVDTTAAGTHTIVFTVTDEAGNTATATRTVNVEMPAAAPAANGENGENGDGAAPEPSPEPTPDSTSSPQAEPTPSETPSTP